MSQNNRDPRSSSCLKEGDLGRGRGRGQIQGKSHLLVLEEKGREDSEKRVESQNQRAQRAGYFRGARAGCGDSPSRCHHQGPHRSGSSLWAVQKF